MSDTICANSTKWFAESVTDIDRLRAIEPVKLGNRHVPVNHGEILGTFRATAESQGLKISDEVGKLTKKGDRYIYTATIDDPATDYGYTVGFVNYNDETKAFQGLLGTRVFVCENGMVHGVVIPSVQRHTTHNYGRIGDKVNMIFDKYLSFKSQITGEINLLKHTKLTDELVGKYILDLHRSKQIGSTNIMRVVDELENPTLNSNDDNSAWRLMNAATYVATHQIGKDNPLAKNMVSKTMHDRLLKLVDPNFQAVDVIEAA